jgi:ribosomal protein S18 acetylase RimI-like enzyme
VSDPSQISFREATHLDFPALLRLMRKLAEQPPALPFDDRTIGAALHEFVGHSELGRIWLMFLEGRLAGYVILTLGFSFEYRGRDAFIDELYIEPHYRRMGLGRRAMQFVAERAREAGVNALHLEVDAENEAALQLYRRAGYQSHGRYLMTRWLREGRG